MIEDAFVTILSVSFSASIVIVCILLLNRPLNHHYVVRWKYWAWLLVLLYLVFPPHLIFTQHTAPLIVNIPDVTISQIYDGYFQTEQYTEPAQVQSNDNVHVSTSNSFALSLANISFVQASSMLWLLGGVGYLCYQFIGYLLFRKRLLRWRKYPDENWMIDLLTSLKVTMGIKRFVCLQISEQINSPLLFGYIHPILVLPEKRYTSEELSYILRHELTHFRRKDLWYKLLLTLAKAIHWFNPLIWFMSQSVNADLECSCDDIVLQNCDPKERKAYSEMLLSFLSQSEQYPSNFTTNFRGSAKILNDRLISIFSSRNKRRGALAQVFIVIILLVGGMCISLAVVPTQNSTLGTGGLHSGYDAPENSGAIIKEGGISNQEDDNAPDKLEIGYSGPAIPEVETIKSITVTDFYGGQTEMRSRSDKTSVEIQDSDTIKEIVQTIHGISWIFREEDSWPKFSVDKPAFALVILSDERSVLFNLISEKYISVFVDDQWQRYEISVEDYDRLANFCILSN